MRPRRYLVILCLLLSLPLAAIGGTLRAAHCEHAAAVTTMTDDAHAGHSMTAPHAHRDGALIAETADEVAGCDCGCGCATTQCVVSGSALFSSALPAMIQVGRKAGAVLFHGPTRLAAAHRRGLLRPPSTL
jgi:phosphoribosylformylglycinamidine (FGAM) synthase-like enzyme